VASVDDLIRQIRKAFENVEYPGDWCLRGSNEGNEPYRLEEEFKGKDDWSKLAPGFLDNAPGGLASALSFFSDEAFRFYLPAYLIADLRGQLERAGVVFHLTHGLGNASRSDRVNPRRYGERTWFEQASHRFSIFDRDQAAAVAAFLLHRRDAGDLCDFEKEAIDDALRNYWQGRTA